MRCIRNSSTVPPRRMIVRSVCSSANCCLSGGGALPQQRRVRPPAVTAPQRSAMTLASEGMEELVDRNELTDQTRNHRNHRFTQVHSSLAQGCIDYVRGWAWQNLLLHRRLLARRRSDCTDVDVLAADDPDIIMLLEHNPVYTLGRGANENHLTCLLDHGSTDMDQSEVTRRQRLSRSFRGPHSARLSVDRRLMEEDLLFRREADAVELLCQNIHPVFAPNGAPIYRVERGGEVTYHGPGQLVAYPLLDLKRHQADLHWFLRSVEEVIILTLKDFDIVGVRDDINTGVWVGMRKVAAVGVSSSRWITTHGFALNVSPDLTYFDKSMIVPCGIQGRTVTSIAEILHERGETSAVPSVSDVALIVVEKIQDVFELEIDSTCRAIQ